MEPTWFKPIIADPIVINVSCVTRYPCRIVHAGNRPHWTCPPDWPTWSPKLGRTFNLWQGAHCPIDGGYALTFI